MKQLQWDKVSKTMLDKTVWGTSLLPEEELVEKLRKGDVWSEIDDAFTAKEAVITALSECFVIDIRRAKTFQTTEGRWTLSLTVFWPRICGKSMVSSRLECMI